MANADAGAKFLCIQTLPVKPHANFTLGSAPPGEILMPKTRPRPLKPKISHFVNKVVSWNCFQTSPRNLGKSPSGPSRVAGVMRFKKCGGQPRGGREGTCLCLCLCLCLSPLPPPTHFKHLEPCVWACIAWISLCLCLSLYSHCMYIQQYIYSTAVQYTHACICSTDICMYILAAGPPKITPKKTTNNILNTRGNARVFLFLRFSGL